MFAQRHLSLKIQCRVTTRTSLGLCHFYSSLPIPANNVAEKAQQRKRKKEKTEEDRKREREYARQYRLAHKEATLQREKLYRSQNRELLRERQRQHYIKKQDTTRNYLPRKNKSWKNQEKVREFLESVKEQLHITDRCDWYRISRVQICEVGGKGLLTTFGNLGEALAFAYPSEEWDEQKFSFRGKKSGQRWLRVMLKKILSKGSTEEPEIVENFLHPDLLWDDRNNLKMELDIWVPKYNLALEYQGEQHYYDIHSAFGPSGTSALYTERDWQKKNLCVEKGITLAIIPYWWDGSSESLQATLHLLRPDLFPPNDFPVIPSNPPQPTKLATKGDQKIYAFFMHGQEWHASKQDPAGWLMSEKLDGIRAFWDGSKFYSKLGKILPVPAEFLSTLPPVTLDGELWAGYESFTKLTPIFKTSHNLEDQKRLSELWKNIKFCVFDAPMHLGNYASRHAFMSRAASDWGPHISIIPYQTCMGFAHLQSTLEEAKESCCITPRHLIPQGELAYKEEDVKYIKCNPNSYTFICEQQNGARCIVKCSGWDYENAPQPGVVLTVKHSGYHKKSHKMKYPFLLRVRPDLEWDCRE